MGEAIARFREMAFAIRRLCDEAVVHPWDWYLLSAGDPFQAYAVAGQLKAGRMPALKFAELLRRSGGIPGVPDVPGLGLFDEERKKILARGPKQLEFERAYSLAVHEAARHPDLLDVVERRLHGLRLSTTALLDLAGDSSSSRFVAHKRKYAAQLLRWHEAYEALAAFIGEPPTAATSTKHKKTSGRKKGGKGPGGTPEKRSLGFYSDAVEWCEKEQKKARKTKQRRKTIPQLLSDYFYGKKMTLSEAIPPQHPGEPWDERATRFWDTAKRRLERAK